MLPLPSTVPRSSLQPLRSLLCRLRRCAPRRRPMSTRRLQRSCARAASRFCGDARALCSVHLQLLRRSKRVQCLKRGPPNFRPAHTLQMPLDLATIRRPYSPGRCPSTSGLQDGARCPCCAESIAMYVSGATALAAAFWQARGRPDVCRCVARWLFADAVACVWAPHGICSSSTSVASQLLPSHPASPEFHLLPLLIPFRDAPRVRPPAKQYHRSSPP